MYDLFAMLGSTALIAFTFLVGGMIANWRDNRFAKRRRMDKAVNR